MLQQPKKGQCAGSLPATYACVSASDPFRPVLVQVEGDDMRWSSLTSRMMASADETIRVTLVDSMD